MFEPDTNDWATLESDQLSESVCVSEDDEYAESEPVP